MLLEKQEMSARDLSRELGIREREVYDHLSHLERSVIGKGKKLTVCPWQCLKCGYVFTDRKRLTRPGRCPRCKHSHMKAALYFIQ